MYACEYLQELYKMEQADPGAKAIVFSQFVNMLDVSNVLLSYVYACMYVCMYCWRIPLLYHCQILEYRIQRGGVGCVKMLGHMNIQQRDNVKLVFILSMYECMYE